MPPKILSSSDEMDEAPTSSNRRPCSLIRLVSAVEMVNDTDLHEHNDEQKRQAEVAQRLHEERRDEERKEHVKDEAVGRENESNVEQEHSDEDDGEHKRDLTHGDSEISLKNTSIGNKVAVSPSRQVLNTEKVEKLSLYNSQREPGSKTQAMVPIIVPESIHNNRQGKSMGTTYLTTGGEDELAPSIDIQDGTPAPGFQHIMNQPYQAPYENFNSAQLTTQMQNMYKELSDIRSGLIRYEERLQHLVDVLLVRRGCVHYRDRYFHDNEKRDERMNSRRRDEFGRGSGAVKVWNGDRQISVEDRQTNANDVSFLTKKMDANEQEISQNSAGAITGCGPSIMKKSAGLGQLPERVVQTTKVLVKMFVGDHPDKAIAEQVKGSVLGKRKVLDDDAGKKKESSPGESRCKRCHERERVRRSVSKR